MSASNQPTLSQPLPAQPPLDTSQLVPLNDEQLSKLENDPRYVKYLKSSGGQLKLNLRALLAVVDRDAQWQVNVDRYHQEKDTAAANLQDKVTELQHKIDELTQLLPRHDQ